MRGPGIGLGIDYTETGVSAVLEFPDGRVTALRFEGSPWLSTAIAVTPLDRLVAGPAAARGRLAHPHRYVSAGSLPSRQSAVNIDGSTYDVGDVAEAVLRTIWLQAKHLAGPRRIARVAIAVSTPLRSYTDAIADAAMRAGMPEPSLADTTEALGDLCVRTEIERRDDVSVAVMRIDGGGAEELSVFRCRAGRLAGMTMHASRPGTKLVDTAAVENLARSMLRMLKSIQRPVAVVCQVPQPLRAAVVSQLSDALGPQARVTCVDESAAAHGALIATDHPLWLDRKPAREHVSGPLTTFGVAAAGALGLLLATASMPVASISVALSFTALVAVGAVSMARWVAWWHEWETTGRHPLWHRTPQWPGRLAVNLVTAAAVTGPGVWILGDVSRDGIAGLATNPILWCGLILAAVLLAVAEAVRRTGTGVDWHTALRMPVAGVAATAAGLVMLHWPHSDVGAGVTQTWGWTALGGAAVGAGVSWSFTAGRRFGAGAAVVGALGGVLLVSLLGHTGVSTLAAAAMFAWWLVCAAQGIRIAWTARRRTRQFAARVRTSSAQI